MSMFIPIHLSTKKSFRMNILSNILPKGLPNEQ
jgi:hypothetical protein